MRLTKRDSGLNILGYLAARDLKVLRQVSHRLQALNAENSLWQQLYLTQWNEEAQEPAPPPTTGNQLQDYRLKQQRAFYQNLHYFQKYNESGWNGFQLALQNNQLSSKVVPLQLSQEKTRILKCKIDCDKVRPLFFWRGEKVYHSLTYRNTCWCCATLGKSSNGIGRRTHKQGNGSFLCWKNMGILPQLPSQMIRSWWDLNMET